MPIRDCIKALEANTFDPTSIRDPFVFLQLHQGRTLIEHMAEYPGAIDLIFKTLYRYGELAKAVPKGKGISHRAILNKYLYLFCEIIAAIHPPDIARWVNDILPEMYHKLIKSLPGNDEEDIPIDPPHYFNFLSQLKPNMPFEVESPLLHTFRKICLDTEIGKVINACEDLPIETLRNTLLRMASNPLYAQSELPTHTSYQLREYAKALPYVMQCDIRLLNPLERQTCIELLLILYNEASPALQESVISLFDQIIIRNKSESFIETLFITIMPYPLGRMQPRFRMKTFDILGQLKYETKRTLESYALFSDYLKVMRIRPDPTLKHLWEPDVNITGGDKRVLSYVLAQGSPVYHYQFVEHFTGTIQDLHYYQIFAPMTGSFPIFPNKTTKLQYLCDPARMKQALALGIRQFHLHDYHPDKWCNNSRLDHWTSVLGETDDSVYLVFTTIGLSIYDAIVTRHGIQPGPLTHQSWLSVGNYQYFLLLNHAPVDPNPNGDFYIIRCRNTIKNDVKTLQSQISTHDTKPIWVLVSRSENMIFSNSYAELLYDLFVYKNRLEYGTFTASNKEFQKIAQNDFPNEITRTPQSLYLIAANQASKLPKLPDDLPEEYKKDIHKIWVGL